MIYNMSKITCLDGKFLSIFYFMNIVQASMLWRKRVMTIASEYPDVELSHMYVDNAAMQLVRNPKQVFFFSKQWRHSFSFHSIFGSTVTII